MKFLVVLILTYFVIHPNNKLKWIMFAIIYPLAVALLYFTESITYWWFKWIIIPLLYALIVWGVHFVVSYIYYQLLANKFVMMRKEMLGINFTMIPPNERNRTIEKFLNEKCAGDNGKYERPINSLARFMEHAPKAQHAAYYNAAAYYFLYIKEDYEAADSCALSCLKLLSCINKDFLTGPYKWIGEKFKNLFDAKGFVKTEHRLGYGMVCQMHLSYFEEKDPNASENPMDSLKIRREK